MDNISEINCNAETLCLTGPVQSFGAYMRLDTDSYVITHVSENVQEILNISPDTLLGVSVNQIAWFPYDMLFALGQNLRERVHVFEYKINDGLYNLQLFRSSGGVNIEIESLFEPTAPNWLPASQTQHFGSNTGAREEREYYDQLVNLLKSILPFFRVLLYKFSESWDGEVVAEASEDGSQIYNKLSFPASDIPAAVRSLYFENSSRYINDTLAENIAIRTATGVMPDLTHSVLRSVSPVHLQYLSNMNVRTSFSIPLMIKGKLWGLISCHSPVPVNIDMRDRMDAERLVKSFCAVFSVFNAGKNLKWLRGIDEKVAGIKNRLKETIKENFPQQLLSVLEAQYDCTAVYVRCHEHEAWHGPAEWRSFVRLFDREMHETGSEPLIHTSNIALFHNQPVSRTAPFRGVIAIRGIVPEDGVRCYILRRAAVQVNKWAGNPYRKIKIDAVTKILTPERSFKKWSETKGDSAEPWSEYDVLFAQKIRLMLIAEMKEGTI